MRPARLLLMILGLLVFGFVLAPDRAFAAEVRTGDAPDVKTGERIDDDFYVAGGSTEIAGEVTGDVLAVAGEVKITGTVGGSLQAIGGKVTVSGNVRGSVRVVTGSLTISGTVSGDVLLAGGSLTLETSGRIGGDLLLAGGEVDLQGNVGGRISGNVGKMTINGRVDGNVDITVTILTLGPRARLGGDLRYGSRNDAEVTSGATVAGTTERRQPDRFYPGDNAAAWLSSSLFRLLCALVTGLIVVLLVPRGTIAVAEAVRVAPLTSLLFGFLLLVFFPILVVVLLVTIVGIPIALIGITLFLSVLYLSQVFLGVALGRLILPKSWDTRSRGYNLLAMTIGVLIISGLRFIPVPYLSVIIATLTGIVGLGAFIVAARASRRAPALPTY